MKSFIQRTSFLCLVILMGLFFSLLSLSVRADEGFDYVPNEVLVKFKTGVDESQKESIRASLGAVKLKEIKSIRVEHWKLPEGLTVENAVELLSNTPCVEHAEPNYLYKPFSLPNDPQFNELWFLHNTGRTINGTCGSPGADISASQAWDLETGSHDVVIAVIDSGVACDHPDLIDNVWVNTDEVPDNGLDDDNNGYVDDVHGWDFVNDDNNPSDYSKDVYGDGHGTHVAGIIAARGNNGLGLTGIMWQAQIMPLQIFDLFNTGSFYEAVIHHLRTLSAIEYAVDNGAKIINCSFGGGPSTQLMYDILNYAHQNGVLVIVAAGNSNNDNDINPSYPSSYDLPNIISVAATNELDELASYSNYGAQTVHVAAPGGNGGIENIYSTVPPKREVLFYDDLESGADQWLTSGIYEPWSYGYNFLFGSTVIQDSEFNYHENEDSYLQTANAIDASNCKGLNFEFKYSYSLEEGYDFLFLEASFDNVNYFELSPGATGFSNGIVHHWEWASDLEIPEPFYLRFHLQTDGSFNYDGVYIDDFILTGIPWTFTGNEYDYKSGTSMSAPVVAGIAGLIWSLNPNLSHLQVKDIILNSVDPLDSLDGKVSTGGRVNAYEALLSVQDNDSTADKEEEASPVSGGGGGGGGCFISTVGSN